MIVKNDAILSYMDENMPVFLHSFFIYMILFKIGGFPLKKKPQLKQDGEIFDPRMIHHLQIAGGLFKKLQEKMGMITPSSPSSLFLNRVVASRVIRRFSLHCGRSHQFSDDLLFQAFRFHEMFGDRMVETSYANMARMFLRGRVELPTSPTMRPFPINLPLAQRLADIGHKFYNCSHCAGILARIMFRRGHVNKRLIIELAKESFKSGSHDGIVAGYECFDPITMSSTQVDSIIRKMVGIDNLDLLYLRTRINYHNFLVGMLDSWAVVKSLVYNHGHPESCVLYAMMLCNDHMIVRHQMRDHLRQIERLDEAKLLLDCAKSAGLSLNSLHIVYYEVNAELEKVHRIVASEALAVERMRAAKAEAESSTGV